MKKILLYLVFVVFSLNNFAQVSWQGGTIPLASQAATLLFDASGTPLEDYDGTIYAHTGVTINNTNHWTNVIGTWGDNTLQPSLTSVSGNIYSLDLNPTISSFYGNPSGTITGIDIVLRTADASSQTADLNILVDSIVNELTLISPTEELIILDSGTQINISATTTVNSDFSLKANGIVIDTGLNTSIYNFDYVITEDANFILEANDGNQILSKTFKARLTPLNPVPADLLDGININPTDNTKATLVLYAPGKNAVHVIGDFNSWQEDDAYLMNHDTARDKFWIELTGLTPQFNHMYQYLVDSQLRIADPYSTTILDETEDQYINATTYPNLPAYPTSFTNYAVTLLRTGDTPYDWQINNFVRPEKTDLVIYELLIRDFDGLHSFDAVKARLDYLEYLGINAIELMPVNEFDGNLSWGYNPSFHMALDKYYGTPAAFKQLIDECHARGIAVLIDVVYNHASGQNPFYRMWNTDNGSYNGQASADNPFFNETPTHAYNVYNDFNHQSTATQNYIERIVKYWINEYKIDGFRWDLTKGFTQNCTPSDEGCTGSYQQDRVDVLKKYADFQWEVDSDFYIIFEHLGGITEEKEWADYRADEGKGIMLWNNLNEKYNEGTMGYHDDGKSDFSNVSYSTKGFDSPSTVSYMESHDEQRLMYKNLEFGDENSTYSVKSLNTALERMETAGALFFTVPGPKMMWQFGELGYDVDIDFNGRTGNKPIRWEYLDDPYRMSIYNTWAKLIELKHQVPIFKTAEFNLDVDNSNGLKSIHLNLPSSTGDEIKYVTIIGNFGITTQSINPLFQEVGTWYDLIDKNIPIEIANTSAVIELAPGEFKIYGNNPFIHPNDLDSDGVLNDNDNCPNTPLGITVDVNGCEVFSLPSSNFTLQVNGETCRSSNNGNISISAAQNLNYTATITGNGVNTTQPFNSSYLANNLEAGDYKICITVEGQPSYQQCFNISITEPEDISVLSKVSNSKHSVSLDMSGSDIYKITLNGVTTTTSNSYITLELANGENNISVEGNKICQGIYKEIIFYNNSFAVFPNPITNNILNIYLGNLNSEKTIVSIHSILGKQLFSQETYQNNLKIDTSNFSKGIYILNINTSKEIRSLKIIKN